MGSCTKGAQFFEEVAPVLQQMSDARRADLEQVWCDWKDDHEQVLAHKLAGTKLDTCKSCNRPTPHIEPEVYSVAFSGAPSSTSGLGNLSRWGLQTGSNTAGEIIVTACEKGEEWQSSDVAVGDVITHINGTAVSWLGFLWQLARVPEWHIATGETTVKCSKCDGDHYSSSCPHFGDQKRLDHEDARPRSNSAPVDTTPLMASRLTTLTLRRQPTRFACIKCNATRCTVCSDYTKAHEYHRGQTCQQACGAYISAQRESLLTSLRGSKRCPYCSVVVWKDGGCNTMTCSRDGDNDAENARRRLRNRKYHQVEAGCGRTFYWSENGEPYHRVAIPISESEIQLHIARAPVTGLRDTQGLRFAPLKLMLSALVMACPKRYTTP